MKKIRSKNRLRIGQLRQFIGFYEDKHFYVVSFDQQESHYGVRIHGEDTIKYDEESFIIQNSILIQESR